MKSKLNRILFLDIETAASCHHFEDLDARTQLLWSKKIRYYISEDTPPEKLWNDKAAIYAEFGQIVCISLGVVKGHGEEAQLIIKSLIGSEKDILQDFVDILNHSYDDPDKHYLCGHNIREFDVPYIGRRLLIHGMKLPKLLRIQGKKPWQLEHLIDTLDMWKFGDYKHYTSLDLLAACFDIPSPKDDISGAEVSEVFHTTQDVARIAHYCEGDVVTEVQIYLKMIGQHIVSDEHIIYRS